MSLFLLIILILLFIVLILFSRVFSPSFLHPIRLIIIFWAMIIVLPVFYWMQRSDFSGGSYFWIVGFLFFMELGATVCKRSYGSQFASGEIKESILANGRSKSWIYLKAIVILGFVSVVVTLITNGIQLSSVFSINGILNVNTYYSSYRSSGRIANASMFSQILSLFIYLSALCGGYCFNYANAFDKSKRLWCVISIFPAILITLLTSGKSGTIASAILWLCAWCVSRAEMYGCLPRVSFKIIRRVSILAIVLLGLLYLAMLLRVGDFSVGTRQAILNKLYTYAFGQTLNFDLWFTRDAKLLGDGLGYNTYMVLPHILGIGNRISGVYYVIAGSAGNVFTAFRGVIQDFGIIGGLLFGFLKGFITEYAYLMVCRKDSLHGNNSKAVLFAEYFWGIYAFIISAWIYTSYFLMPFAFGIFLYFYHRALIVRIRVRAHARQ